MTKSIFVQLAESVYRNFFRPALTAGAKSRMMAPFSGREGKTARRGQARGARKDSGLLTVMKRKQDQGE